MGNINYSSLKNTSFTKFITTKAHVSIDTQFCTHNLIKENDLNDQSMYPKNYNCITCINLFLHYMHHFVFALHALIHLLHIIKMIFKF